jgi:hypothetical protein
MLNNNYKDSSPCDLYEMTGQCTCNSNKKLLAKSRNQTVNKLFAYVYQLMGTF